MFGYNRNTHIHTYMHAHLPSNIIVWTCLTPPAHLTELHSFMIYHCYLVNMRFKASTDHTWIHALGNNERMEEKTGKKSIKLETLPKWEVFKGQL